MTNSGSDVLLPRDGSVNLEPSGLERLAGLDLGGVHHLGARGVRGLAKEDPFARAAFGLGLGVSGVGFQFDHFDDLLER